MNLWNSLRSILGQSGESPPSPEHQQLLTSALAMFGGEGLNGFLDRLREKGLGDAVQSWIGTGANKPISGEQVQESLGQDKIEEISQQANLPKEETAQGLAQLLPQLVDKLTPDGKLPDAAGLGNMLGSLKAALGAKPD